VLDWVVDKGRFRVKILKSPRPNTTDNFLKASQRLKLYFNTSHFQQQQPIEKNRDFFCHVNRSEKNYCSTHHCGCGAAAELEVRGKSQILTTEMFCCC